MAIERTLPRVQLPFPAATVAKTVGRFARRKPLGAFGGVLVMATVLVAFLAPVLATQDPQEIVVGERLLPPSSEHWMGTDYLARDMFSRVVYGARISMYVGLVTVLLGSAFGGILGILSAWVGGWFDLLLQRIVDSLAAFPHLVLALIVVTATGRSLNGIILALVLVNTPLITRTLRSAALSVKEAPYVESGRAIGAGHIRLLRLYVLPNCFAPIIVLASITVGWAIVVEATLSFLGLGLPPNVPSWGGMLSGMAQRTAAATPWVAVFPGLALSLTVYGINLLGDGLRDVLDPRLRGG